MIELRLSPLIADSRPRALLALADGTVFHGRAIGAPLRTLVADDEPAVSKRSGRHEDAAPRAAERVVER